MCSSSSGLCLLCGQLQKAAAAVMGATLLKGRAMLLLLFAAAAIAFQPQGPFRLQSTLRAVGTKQHRTPLRPLASDGLKLSVLCPEAVEVATTMTGFEPQLDVGALAGFVSIAFVTTVFWARVIVATDDRKKRDAVQKRRRELLIKRITGMLKPGDEDDLVRAEAEMQESGRVGWRQLMRRVKLVTEKSPSSVEGEDDQAGMPTTPSSSSSLE